MVVQEKDNMEQKIISSAKTAISDLVKLTLVGKRQLWVDYDKEVDVLYLSFGKPQKAEKSLHGEDDIIRRKKGNNLVGLTVLNASRFI